MVMRSFPGKKKFALPTCLSVYTQQKNVYAILSFTPTPHPLDLVPAAHQAAPITAMGRDGGGVERLSRTPERHPVQRLSVGACWGKPGNVANLNNI